MTDISNRQTEYFNFWCYIQLDQPIQINLRNLLNATLIKCPCRPQRGPRLGLRRRGLRKGVRLRKIGSGELQAGKRDITVMIFGAEEYN